MFARARRRALPAGGLAAARPCPPTYVGPGIDARRVGVRDLVALAADPPAGPSPAAAHEPCSRSSSSRTVRVAEGLVHPYLDHGDGGWHAFWGATLDATVQASLAEIAAALPPIAADAFDGDRDAIRVHDLYPVACRPDRARPPPRRPREPRRHAAAPSVRRSSSSSTGSPGPSLLPPHSGYAALKWQLSRWVYDGLGALARGSEASWARPPPRRATVGGETELGARCGAAGGGRPDAQPAGLARVGGRRRHLLVPARERSARRLRAAAGRARAAARRARHSLRRRGVDRGELDVDAAGASCASRCRSSRRRACRCSCRPRGSAPSRRRVNLTATSRRDPTAARAGCSRPRRSCASTGGSPSATPSLDEEELVELAKAKDPFVRVAGRWHALRRSEVERALRFLERHRDRLGARRSRPGGLGARHRRGGARARRGDARRVTDAAARRRRAALPLAADAEVDGVSAVPVPGAGPRLAAHARRSRRRRDPGRRHGPREDGAGDRDARLRAGGDTGSRSDARRLSDERRQTVGRRDRAVRAVAAGAVASRHRPSRGQRAHRRACERRTSSSRPTTSRRATSRRSRSIEWDRLLLDEAQDIKNPATKRARALRRAARAAASRDDGHADREPAQRAVGDHGHRQSRPARSARLVRPHVRAADRGVQRREGAGEIAGDRAAVRAAPREGRAGGGAGAAADHDREGLLPAHGRAGEPLPGDGRPLDAGDRGAARQLRTAGRRCSRC